MDQNAHERDREYIANELVVANPHLDLVMRQLDGAGVIDKDPDADLGLTLLRLGDVETAVTQVRQAREAAGATAPQRDPGLPELPLEDLLGELRALFEHGYDGWTPTMGKNRVMRGVQLFPYPSAGGGRRPTLPTSTGRPSTAASADAGQGVRVAVLDTPVFPHTRLAGRYITASGSLLPVDGGVRPWSAGHATFVAGLILQQAPAAELRIESVLEADGSTADVWTVARRLVKYASMGFDVMNLSFGSFTIDGRPPLVLERAIGRITPGTVVIAAAGNYGEVPAGGSGVDELPKPTTPIWPAAFDDVIAVGALDGEKPAVFNSTGAWVKLMAPGVDLQSTYLVGEVTGHESQDGPEERDTFDGVAQWSGTSFAAAVVTGAIAALTVRGRRTAYEALAMIRERAGQNGIGIRLP